MSESKQQWTPGPWELEVTGWDNQLVYGYDAHVPEERRFIAEVSLYYDGANANAKLIAAAPELVEALSELLEYAVILGADYLDTFREWPADATIQGWPKERWIRAREAEDKARAALAKAGA